MHITIDIATLHVGHGRCTQVLSRQQSATLSIPGSPPRKRNLEPDILDDIIEVIESIEPDLTHDATRDTRVDGHSRLSKISSPFIYLTH